MPSQHKRPPLRIRLPEGDQAWLHNESAKTGEAVNRILVLALQAERKRREGPCHESETP